MGMPEEAQQQFLQMNAVDRCNSRMSGIYAEGQATATWGFFFETVH